MAFVCTVCTYILLLLIYVLKKHRYFILFRISTSTRALADHCTSESNYVMIILGNVL